MTLEGMVEKTESSGKDMRMYLPRGLEYLKEWRLNEVDRRRCFLAKLESEIREFHDLHMHRY